MQSELASSSGLSPNNQKRVTTEVGESPAAVNLASAIQSEQELLDLRSKTIELTAYINELNRANDEFQLENNSLKLSTEDLKVGWDLVALLVFSPA